METQTIDTISEYLAKEITQIVPYEESKVKKMIAANIRSGIRDLLTENLDEIENQYLKLLEKQCLYQRGSTRHYEIGQKIKALKVKRGQINRVKDNAKAKYIRKINNVENSRKVIIRECSFWRKELEKIMDKDKMESYYSEIDKQRKEWII